MPLILGTNSIKDTGFDVANSLRFNGGNTDSLSRTPSSASNRRTYTISMWFKRSSLTSDNGYSALFTASAGDSGIFFNNDGTLEWYDASGQLDTSRVFRDASAWYHVVVAQDTTQGTASNRVKLYINGVQETDFDTENYPNQNAEGLINNTGKHSIGVRATSTTMKYGGYMAEVVLIDGTALDPTSFGEFDSNSPTIWKPKDVSGLTFGTNGFYLDFQDSSSLGNDAAGSNNFTVNNLGAVDQSTDTCTNNFCTLNPLTKRDGGTLSEGNLKYTASTGDSSVFGTIGIPAGMKIYFEAKLVNNTAQNSLGIHNLYDGGDGAFVKGGSEAGTYAYKVRGSGNDTQYINNGSIGGTVVSNYSNDTIIGVAVDNANGQIHYSANGTFINSSDPTDNNPAALVTGFGGSNEQYLHFSLDTTSSQPIIEYNFGSPAYAISSGNADGDGFGNFEYAVPSGYFALCTKNLAEYG